MDKKHLLEICLTQIEEKYDKGSRTFWTHKNYLELSKEISSTSTIHISQSSLKRLYGKVKYNYFPQIQTRNALCIYLGYNDWEAFANSVDTPATKESKNTPLRIVASALIILSILISSYLFNKSQVELHVKNNIGQAPFQVLLNYKLPYVANSDYCIDFDEVVDKNCIPLNPNEKSINYTFIHSDVYHIALKKGDEIIKTHSIVAESKGWESLICTWEDDEGYCENLYSSENIKKDGILQVSPAIVSPYGFDTTDTYWIKHRNIKNLNNDGTSFTFETKFRNQSTKDLHDCPVMNFAIIGKEHNIKVNLASYGCIAFDHPIFEFADKIVLATIEDMSVFELDMEKWNTLNLKVDKLHLTASIDSIPFFETTLNKNIGDIYGIIIDIKGAGEVDFVRIMNEDNEVTFEDNFD